MDYLPDLIPIIAFVVTVLGLAGALACNSSSCPVRVCWGRRIYLLNFILVAAACFIMAIIWPRGVLPSCLAMAALFLGMLWHPSTPVEEGDLTA